MTTRDQLRVSALARERRWNQPLYEYVTRELAPTEGLWSGWEILKGLSFLTRSQRRKLWGSKRWTLHLFAGREGHWPLFRLDQSETSVIELGISRCAGQDLLWSEVWRALMWGAMEGKVDVILGGPPGRSSQFAKGGERSINKDVTLIARLLSLHMWGEVNGRGVNRNRDVGFVLEYPEGLTPEEKLERERRIEAADAAYRSWSEHGEPADWEETNNYRDERWMHGAAFGTPGCERRSSARRKSERFPLIRVQWGSLHETAGT